MSKGTVHIHTLLNPITRERAYTKIEAGKPLSEHLTVPDGVLVFRNGLDYEDEVLQDGDILNVIKVPKGDSGKQIGRTAAIIGAQLLAATLTSGLSTIASSLITVGATVATTAGLNFLERFIPWSQPNTALGENAEFTRLGSLTGSRNRINQYGAVPKVYGRRKVFPPMSAKPYTEIIANQQYMRLLFAITEGPCQLSEPRIGDTIIGSFDASNRFTSNGTFEDIQVSVGESPFLYSTTVNEQVPGTVFTAPSDTFTRTTDIDTEEISIDLTFPQGLFGIDENGNTIGVWMHWKVEYSPTGQNLWTEVTGQNVRDVVAFTERPGAATGWRSTGNERETWRGGLSWEVPKGQYDVRITRIDGPFTSREAPQIFERAIWSALRSIEHEEPTDMPGVVQCAIRIKATDQITGVLDNFSVIVDSRLATYNGISWSVPTFNPSNGTGTGGAITSNTAWVMADILTGTATKEPISRSELNGDSFRSWAQNCQNEGRFCNLVVDQSQTVLQLAATVGATGRGSLGHIDGTYKVIQDLDETTPVQHFTPRNSWGFSSTRTFHDVPHAFRMNFINPDADWQTDEAVVYDDGYSEDGTNCQFPDGSGVCKKATRFRKIDLQGVTNWDQAWKEGRYRLAELRLRPEVYVLNADVENIICNRGDMVRASHDVTLWGIKSARIKSISGNIVTLDDEVTMEAGGNYNIRVRNSSNDSIVKSVVTNAGTTDVISVSNTNNIQVGDLVSFGFVNRETQQLKVLSIQPRGDLTAQITLVDEAPEIYEADTGPIPDFDSNITSPPEDITNLIPPTPSLVSIRSDFSTLYPDSNGVPQLRIVVTFTTGTGNPTDFIEGRFRKVDGTTWTSFGIVEASMGTMSLFNVEQGDIYIIQIRARNGAKASPWVEGLPHTAGEGILIPPHDRFKIGVLTADVAGNVSELPVNLDVPVRQGVTYEILRSRGGTPAYFTVGGTFDQIFGPGILSLPIQPQTIRAQEGSIIVPNASQFTSQLIVDPGRIQLSVERVKTADGIGVLSADRTGAITDIPLQDIDEEIILLHDQELRIINKQGRNERVLVNGDQLVTAPSYTIAVQPVTLLREYTAGFAWVREPSYKQTGRINVESNRIDLNVTDINDNSQSIAALSLDVSGNDQAIATLETDVTANRQDIASNLSQIDDNAQIITQNANSILTLSSEVGDNTQAISSLESSVTTVEDDVGAIIRQNNAPTQRKSGDPLVEGDIWIDRDNSNNAFTWDGNSWEPYDGVVKTNVAGIENVVNQYEAKSMLYAKADGKIAFVQASSGQQGTNIQISADQIHMNNVVFDEGGNIRSSNFQANVSGWRIQGNGDAEFNSVVIRNGSIASPIISNFRYRTNYETPPGPASFNNYHISNKAALFIAPTGGTITFTGIESQNSGSVIVISNRGSSSLVLSNQNGSSNASNRIITPTGSNYSITPGDGAMLIYDGNSNRWRFLAAT